MNSSQIGGREAGDATPPDAEFYDRRTIHMHWLTAFLVVALWLIAQIIDDFPKGMPRIAARSTHIVLGLVLLIVVIRRIWWRTSHGRHLAAPGPRWMAVAATAAHHLLYFGLVAVLLLGITNAWVRGDNVFGLFSIPKLMPGHTHLRPIVESLHEFAADGLLVLAALHALAALWHHYIVKDGVLRRMLGR